MSEQHDSAYADPEVEPADSRFYSPAGDGMVIIAADGTMRKLVKGELVAIGKVGDPTESAQVMANVVSSALLYAARHYEMDITVKQIAGGGERMATFVIGLGSEACFTCSISRWW